MFSKKHRSILVVAASDTHPNSHAGLHPPVFKLDDGSIHLPNSIQKWSWDCWLDFWKWVAKLKRQFHAECWYVHNGDGADDNTHSQYGLVSRVLADIINIGVAIQNPSEKIADKRFFVRGTEAHTGGYGALEEIIATRLKGIPDPSRGTSSWWFLPLVANGVAIDFAHHAATYSRRPWTRGAGANRQAAIEAYNYEGQNAPQISFYAHGHYLSDSGLTHSTRVIYLPPWQATTSFGHRIGYKFPSATLGGIVVLCDKGSYRVFQKTYSPEPMERFDPRKRR